MRGDEAPGCGGEGAGGREGTEESSCGHYTTPFFRTVFELASCWCLGVTNGLCCVRVVCLHVKGNFFFSLPVYSQKAILKIKSVLKSSALKGFQ